MQLTYRAARIAALTLLIATTASCGFHLRDTYNLPAEIKTLSVTSFDPYGNLARDIKTQLRYHGVKVVPPKEGIANLRLDSESYGESTLSLYQNSRVAQKQFSYNVSYNVSVPEKGSYRFSTSLSRSYLDNPLTALAKSVEEEMLAQEMRVEASKQIIRQLARLKADIEQYEIDQRAKTLLNENYQSLNGAGNKIEIKVETRAEGKVLPPEASVNSQALQQAPNRFLDHNNVKATQARKSDSYLNKATR